MNQHFLEKNQVENGGTGVWFDLADYLGIARETVARAFARLEHEGLARRLKAGNIEILDMNGLRQLQRAGRRRNTDFSEP